MNRIISEQYGLFGLYQQLRGHLLDVLTDEDLAFTPGGANPPLGRLCVEIGETEQSYIDSFKTFNQTFDYRHEDRSLENSVSGLRGWYEQLDQSLYAVIAGLSEEDVNNRLIDRGHNFRIPPGMQLEIYKEALIIFYGKTTVYLKLLGKTPSERWHDWLG